MSGLGLVLTIRYLLLTDIFKMPISLEVVTILIGYRADVNNTVAFPNAVADSRKYHSVSAGRLDIVAYLFECGMNINLMEPFDDGFD